MKMHVVTSKAPMILFLCNTENYKHYAAAEINFKKIEKFFKINNNLVIFFNVTIS